MLKELLEIQDLIDDLKGRGATDKDALDAVISYLAEKAKNRDLTPPTCKELFEHYDRAMRGL